MNLRKKTSVGILSYVVVLFQLKYIHKNISLKSVYGTKAFKAISLSLPLARMANSE